MTKWVGLSRNVEALEGAVRTVAFDTNFRWHPEGLPDCERELIEEIKAALFTTDDALWKQKKRAVACHLCG